MDIVRHLQRANAGRAMRRSAFDFLRGSNALFVARLRAGGAMRAAPLAWCCGDLHLHNFGSYHGENGRVYFDINDFDEACRAPLSWDLVRLTASLLVAADELGLDAADGRALAEALLQHHAQTLAGGKPFWVERDTATGEAAALLRQLRERKRRDFLDSRTTGSGSDRRLRLDTGKALPASAAQRDEAERLVRRLARASASGGSAGSGTGTDTPNSTRANAGPALAIGPGTAPDPKAAVADAPDLQVLDVARRIAGTGSLGLPRYVVLVRGSGGSNGQLLLDLKAAAPSALAARLTRRQPDWPDAATRITALQRRLQAMPVARLQALHLRGQAWVARELHPSEDGLDVRRLHADAEHPLQALHGLVQTLGRVTAWAHLRGAAHRGAAGPDALQAWGAAGGDTARLLRRATEAADTVRADARRFRQAADAGAFGPLAAAEGDASPDRGRDQAAELPPG